MIYDVTANEKDREIRLILSKTKATICIKKIMPKKFPDRTVKCQCRLGIVPHFNSSKKFSVKILCDFQNVYSIQTLVVAQ